MLYGETKQFRFISSDVSLCKLLIMRHVGFIYVDESGLWPPMKTGCLHYSRHKRHKAIMFAVDVAVRQMRYGRRALEHASVICDTRSGE